MGFVKSSMKRTLPGRVYAGGTPNFDERTGIRTAGIKPMRPPGKDAIQSPPIIPRPQVPLFPSRLGEGGMSPGQLPTGDVRTMEFIDANNNGVDDRDEKPPIMSGPMPPSPRFSPIEQEPIVAPPPPMRGGPMPPPSMRSSDELFGDPGAGSYDNLMSRAFQEYSSGQSPYSGAADFLMNRSVFDRGARPQTSMPSTDMPSYGYSDAGGSGGLAAMQAQQPGIQAQYDQFAQQIQSAQEAAQQQAQQQTDMASTERQALMDRIAALEGQEGPDLDSFGAQLRQDILGQIPEQLDIEALRREITGEVLALAQQDFPDVTQIRDEVMRLLPEQEQVDVENLRRQIQESIDTGAPPEQIDALRQELQNRIRPVEEQLQGLQDERTDIAGRLGELQGRVGALPEIDVDALRQQIIQQLPEQERVDIEALQRQIQDGIDAGMSEQQIAGLRSELNQRLTPVEERVGQIRESVGQLRGRFDQQPGVDIEDIRRRVQEGIDLSSGMDANAMNEAARRALEERGGFVPPDVLERLRAVEGREGPDLSGIRERIAALREQQGQATEGRRGLSELLANVREQQGQAAEGRRAIEDRLGGRLEEVRGQVSPLTERIAQLRGRLDERPTVDMDAIARRVREGINIPQVDLGGIREQIANLRGRLDERVPAGTAGIKPLPAPPKSPPIKPSIRYSGPPKPPPKTLPRMGTFPPGFMGSGRGSV